MTTPDRETAVARAIDVTTTNSNGNTIRSWASGEWRVLHVKAAGAETTVSLRDHEAWRVARGLSPELAREIDSLGRRLSEAQAALWTFQNMPVAPDTLRSIALEWECGADCDNGHRESDTNAFICSKDGDGCRWAEAEDLRRLAQAIETRGDMSRIRQVERERAARIVRNWSLPTIQSPSMWLIDREGIAAEILSDEMEPHHDH